MKRLSRAQIDGAKDLRVVEISTPEWAPEGTPEDQRADWGVGIRNLTGSGRAAFIAESLDIKARETRKDKADFKIELLLVLYTAVDPDNKPLYTKDELDVLGARDAQVISRLAAQASMMAGLDEEAKRAAEKKSAPATS